ncbi:4-hydroxybenzoate octaprenyltransferase [Candidatus Photodesmus anomalopis]|uniref:4-hydroxybenzoate octaprenyltransferase n=1 Tax=Candidatus Photodesmus katoptron Akat1 TaxID=1236703 RepID=S3DZV8_9GAMM|nr:4-hydroxybenzoate octaprenyltransferase [Candidatus Photodesmus katoptron]EPE37501.1 4-hydroxybenzoate polyprenyl transferase [Candidatus Photodesmus katoptron Akat1]
MLSKIHAYYQIMRLGSPIGSFLLIWPTLWALIISSEGNPNFNILAVFIAGAFLMRTAGCVINDLVDRKIDIHVKRTQNRPIPVGLISSKEAFYLFLVLSSLAFILVSMTNLLTIKLSFIAILFVIIYPFLKRITHLPQLFLGLTFSFSILMAWAAQSNELPAEAWYLFTINVLWIIAYDTQYAMIDRDDDLKIGLKSTAILFGRFDKICIGILQFLTVFMLIILGIWYKFNISFYFGLFIVSILFIFQQFLIKNREREYCFKAFLNNNYVGMIIAIALKISYL